MSEAHACPDRLRFQVRLVHGHARSARFPHTSQSNWSRSTAAEFCLGGCAMMSGVVGAREVDLCDMRAEPRCHTVFLHRPLRSSAQECPF